MRNQKEGNMKLSAVTLISNAEQKFNLSHRANVSPALLATALATMVLALPATAQQQSLGPRAHTGAPTRTLGRSANRAPESRSSNANPNVRYTVTEIGVVPGKQSSFLAVSGSVNNNSVVAGYSYNGEFGDSTFLTTAVAFTWENGVLQPLPLLSGWASAFAFGLNEHKQVYGTANNTDAQGNLMQTAIIWDRGIPVNLGTLHPNSVSAALGINNRDEVVGSSFSLDTNISSPFVWYKGQMTALPLLPNAVGGEADGINDGGQIVGFLDFGSTPPPGTGEFHSVLWSPKSQGYVVQDLGTLGGDFGSAQYINNRGQVVGWASDESGDSHAYFWSGGPLQELSTETAFSQAFAINQREQILGRFLRADDNVVLFLWEDGVLTDLNDLVPPGTPLLNFSPGGLNNRGEIAATAVLPDGTTVAFLLTPIQN
jgi:probable HAF family extracellular repeat protein